MFAVRAATTSSAVIEAILCRPIGLTPLEDELVSSTSPLGNGREYEIVPRHLTDARARSASDCTAPFSVHGTPSGGGHATCSGCYRRGGDAVWEPGTTSTQSTRAATNRPRRRGATGSALGAVGANTHRMYLTSCIDVFIQ
jgi:hypothetical protein